MWKDESYDPVTQIERVTLYKNEWSAGELAHYITKNSLKYGTPREIHNSNGQVTIQWDRNGQPREEEWLMADPVWGEAIREAKKSMTAEVWDRMRGK